MKNSIHIDVDTERDQPILIGKAPDVQPPANAEEASAMIIEDISCVCEALCTLIHMSDQNGYGKKEDLVKASIQHLSDMLVEPKTDETEKA